MARKRKIKPDKNFRKESRRQENKMYAIIGAAALLLAILITMINKIDFMACSNTGDSVTEIIEGQDTTDTDVEASE